MKLYKLIFLIYYFWLLGCLGESDINHSYEDEHLQTHRSESEPSRSSSSQSPQFNFAHTLTPTRYGPLRPFITSLPSPLPSIYTYLAVPYASPPVGPLMFMPPVSPSPWSSPRASTSFPPSCPQILPKISNNSTHKYTNNYISQLKRLIPTLRNQSADCLYLNIYVPHDEKSGNSGGPLPIVVVIHGLEFSWGGSSNLYNPTWLSGVGRVIVVTVNYRLGIGGFLNPNTPTSPYKSPANFALLDQIAALHWIQENIHNFGGNAHNVTLMGINKGAIYVSLLMLSGAVPKGLLFHRSILISGSALSPIVTSKLNSGQELARELAEKVGCMGDTSSEILGCLREESIDELVDKSEELSSQFTPSSDTITITSADFNSPSVLTSKLSNYPLLFGTNSFNTEIMYNYLNENDWIFGVEGERRREILGEFISEYYKFHQNEILAAAIHEYTEWERPIQHPINLRDETIEAISDAEITSPLVSLGDLHSPSPPTSTPAYFYIFDHTSKSTQIDLLNYLFGHPLSNYFNKDLKYLTPFEPQPIPGGNSQQNYTRNEVLLCLMVINWWSSFIWNGNPNSSPNLPTINKFVEENLKISPPNLKPIDWPIYDGIYKKYLNIDLKPRSKSHYRAHKLSFWLNLVPDLNNGGKNRGVNNQNHHSLNGSYFSDGDSKSSLGNNTLSVATKISSENSGGSGSSKNIFFNHVTQNTVEQDSTRQLQTAPSSDDDSYQIYSTALSVTIAIGCSLLILNILIFAMFYYQKDLKNKQRENDVDYFENENINNKTHHHHHHHGNSGGESCDGRDPNSVELFSMNKPQQQNEQNYNPSSIPSMDSLSMQQQQQQMMPDVYRNVVAMDVANNQPSSQPQFLQACYGGPNDNYFQDASYLHSSPGIDAYLLANSGYHHHNNSANKYFASTTLPRQTTTQPKSTKKCSNGGGGSSNNAGGNCSTGGGVVKFNENLNFSDNNSGSSSMTGNNDSNYPTISNTIKLKSSLKKK